MRPLAELPDGTTSMTYKFTGKERDAETGDANGYNGWDDFGARYYGALMGRWVSPDPYNGSMDLGNPQSLNRYAYVNNTPLTLTDPTGLFPLGCGFSTSAGSDGAISIVFGGGAAAGPAGLVIGGIEAAACLFTGIEDLLGLFKHAQLKASLKPRPDAPNWLNSDTFNTPYHGLGGAIGGVMGGSGNGGCEFGGCGVEPNSFQAGAISVPVASGLGCIVAEPCGAYALGGASLFALGALMRAQAVEMSKRNVAHDYVRELARNEPGDYCTVLKAIMDAARRNGNAKLFNDAKATWKQDCRGYGR